MTLFRWKKAAVFGVGAASSLFLYKVFLGCSEKEGSTQAKVIVLFYLLWVPILNSRIKICALFPHTQCENEQYLTSYNFMIIWMINASLQTVAEFNAASGSTTASLALWITALIWHILLNIYYLLRVIRNPLSFPATNVSYESKLYTCHSSFWYQWLVFVKVVFPDIARIWTALILIFIQVFWHCFAKWF